jgi:hypothetical protein
MTAEVDFGSVEDQPRCAQSGQARASERVCELNRWARRGYGTIIGRTPCSDDRGGSVRRRLDAQKCGQTTRWT